MRAPETPDLLNVCASCINIQGEVSTQGFNHRLLNGLQQGAAACGAESPNYQTNWLHEANWPLAVTRLEVDGVILPFGNEFGRHPLFPAPVPAVFIFNGPEGADVVTVANFDASLAIGRHLTELGHRRVAYIGFKTNLRYRRRTPSCTRTPVRTNSGCLRISSSKRHAPATPARTASQL